MAKRVEFSKSSDGEHITATPVNSELQQSYNEYVESHPEPEIHIPEQTQQPAQNAKAPQQTQNINAGVSAPKVQEPEYVYDSHFSQQWFLDELENRKNPEYVKQGTDIMDDSTFEAIANAVKIRKDATPDQWKYGDPGWKTDTDLYQEYIKPMETKYRQQIHNAQIAEMEKSAYDSAMENTKYNPSADAGVNKNAGDFDKLNLWGKIVNLGTPGNAGTDVNNSPGISKLTQPFITAMASSGGPAKILQDAAIVAGVPFAGQIYGASKAAAFAYNYTKALGLHQGNPTVDKMFELVDLPDEKMQQALGAFNYGFEMAGGGDLADTSKLVENMDFIAKNIDTILDYGFGSKKASTEYDSDIVGLVTGATANMGATPVIGDVADRAILNAGSFVLDKFISGKDTTKVDYGQTTRYNLGQAGAHDIPEELLGSNATEYWLKTVQGWRDEGVTDINDLTYMFWNELTRVYGDKSNLSEFTEHEFFDPSNTMENMETRAIGAYADITNDKNLSIAAKANTGTWFGDLTENIPVIPDIIRGIGKMVGDNDILRTSNGINEVLSAWNQENIYNPTYELTSRDKRFSGIDKNGEIKDMTPNKGKVLADNKVGEYIARAFNLTQKTNETKAAYEGDAIFDYINVMVEDAIRARGNEDINTTIDRLVEFVDELEHPETISTKSPFYRSSQSAMFNSIKGDVAEAVRTSRENIINDINRFRNLENNRNVLYTVASALNMTPSQLMEKYNNEKTVLTQMIVNKANENGGTIPGIDIPVDSTDFGEHVIQMIRPFAGDDGQAYDVRQLGLQITSNLADGVTNTLVRKYNIQPEGLTYRFGDMIKKMQSLVLLGLSPSYLANNFINNVATRTALGYGGYLSGKTMNDWMTRFGYTPERMQDSFTEAYMGTNIGENTASEKLGAAIKKKKDQVDGKGIKKGLANFMKNTGDFASKVNNKVGIFSKLSGEVEKAESQQVSVSAMMTYMARTWKPGVNFRKMPVQLEAAINAQCPGMVKAIYSAVAGGINMAEIEKAIFGSFILPSVKDSLIEAANNKGFERADDIITEYFVKNGMLDQLNRALEGKRGEEIDRIVDEFSDQLRTFMSVQLSGDIAERAEAIKNMTGQEKFVAAINVGTDMADEMADIWNYTADMNTNLFRQRLEEGMAPSKFHELYRKQQEALNERWQGVYATSQQVYSGVLDGLGMNDKASRLYIDNLKSQQDVWVKFYGETQPKTIQPYLDALEWRLDDTVGHRENGKWVPGTWDTRVKKAWKTYLANMKKAYQAAINEEKTYQTAMDNAYIAGLKNSLGETKSAEVDQTIAPLFKEMRDKRQEYITQLRAIRDKADKTSILEGKHEAWQEGNQKRAKIQDEYKQKQHELYANILALAPFTIAPAGDMDFDAEDHAINIRADVAQHEANAMKTVASRFNNKMTDAILDGKPITGVASPISWWSSMRRSNLSDVANSIGMTQENLNSYYDYVSQWEKNHPGHDYFMDKLGFHMESVFDGDKDVEQKVKDDVQRLIDNDFKQEEVEPKSNLTPEQAEQRKAVSQEEFKKGRFVPLEDMDLSSIESSGSRDAEVDRLANLLHEREMNDPDYTGEHHTPLQYKQYILNSKNEDGTFALPLKDYQDISAYISLSGYSDFFDIREEIEALRVDRKYQGNVPQKGDYVAPTYSFDYGGEEIVAIVTHDRKVVAYVPANMPLTEVDYDKNGIMIQVLGYSPDDPEMLVYKIGDDVRTEPRRENDGSNPYQGDMDFNTTPELDPVPQAHSQMTYEQILPILDEFIRVYKQNLDDNMTNQNYSKLDSNTRSLLRGYIDTDVRTDLVNTKYKAGKFGNMMRDAALLNYNSRYGWDNALTFICPYQFWQTRSFQKWMSRMGSKGGKMWRRYAKLKELERRNKKEFMPSRISGLIGLYLPFLPDWMGDAIFMSTDQFLVVPQFVNNLFDSLNGKNAVRAVAERYLREALQDEKISYQDYQLAMNPQTREQSSVWQEYLSKAQLTEGADQNLGDMLGQYLGLSLPLSIYKAISKNDNSEWNQWPITRTGTAWRAAFGDNLIGNLGQDILSFPEKTLRSLLAEKYGTDFEYNEFGAFADYYITQQVWDMVPEGRIDPVDAVQAVTEKGNNKIWNEAADRQREELLVKMQGGLPVEAVKRLVSGEGDTKDNWLMLLAGLVTAPMSKQVVREAETDWRKQKDEYSKAWDAYSSGDKEALNRFEDSNPNYRYNNLRYEKDPEQALRKYLYNTISQKWYDLDKEEQSELQMAFGPNDNFYDDVINKDTRVIESMDINRLAAYAQALNGKIPNLATDKINLQNIESINLMQFPDTTHDEVMTYYAERDRLFPGMNKVSSIYYSLPVEDRKKFRQAMPELSKYWDWNKQYKKDHPDVANFTKIQSDYFDAIDAENVIDNLDNVTLSYLKQAAFSGQALEPEFKPLIENAMRKARITDKYDTYVKDLMKYILGK